MIEIRDKLNFGFIHLAHSNWTNKFNIFFFFQKTTFVFSIGFFKDDDYSMNNIIVLKMELF